MDKVEQLKKQVRALQDALRTEMAKSMGLQLELDSRNKMLENRKKIWRVSYQERHEVCEIGPVEYFYHLGGARYWLSQKGYAYTYDPSTSECLFFHRAQANKSDWYIAEQVEVREY